MLSYRNYGRTLHMFVALVYQIWLYNLLCLCEKTFHITQWISPRYVSNVDGIKIYTKDPQFSLQCRSCTNDKIKRKNKQKTTEEKLASAEKKKNK